ncbi:hypothetical protein MUK42_02566 [Musa troglodytarum]|uniref:Uncharacterized protein n=1 Tax=Musa troglodytarum TaxID=320322 RepID=A0A9E7EJ88_9LILI|nr:hypothetical protein MUK42_02566 [Musa troglodytarum]
MSALKKKHEEHKEQGHGGRGPLRQQSTQATAPRIDCPTRHWTKAKASDCHLSLLLSLSPPPPLPCPSMAESRMVELSSPTTNLQEPRDPLCSLLSETE